MRGFEPPPAASHDGELATGPKARPHFLQVQMDKRYIHDTTTTYMLMCTLISQFRLSRDAGEVAALALAAALTVSFS